MGDTPIQNESPEKQGLVQDSKRRPAESNQKPRGGQDSTKAELIKKKRNNLLGKGLTERLKFKQQLENRLEEGIIQKKKTGDSR